MRLADDPLELNVFLRRGATPAAHRPDMVRVHAGTLSTAAVSKDAPSEARIYAGIEAPAGDPAAPEAFVPSKEDRDVAFTLDPEAPAQLAGPVHGIWPAVGAVGAAVVLLVVLML
jgi:hypothetical protein